MSMDLYLWKAPVIDDPEEARALIDRYYDEKDLSVFERSEDVVRALAKIRQQYPDNPDSDSGPWSSWPIEDSDRLIALNIRWSVDNEVLDKIVAIAAEHDLVLYDPQGPDVYLARDASGPPPADEKPTVKDFVSVMMMFLPIAGATAAAWWFIPWGWLRWPLVAIGLFVTSAAFMVVYLTVAAMFQRPKDEPTVS